MILDIIESDTTDVNIFEQVHRSVKWCETAKLNYHEINNIIIVTPSANHLTFVELG